MQPFVGVVDFEIDFRIVTQELESQLRNDRGVMDENIRSSGRIRDESVPFPVVEPFNPAFGHNRILVFVDVVNSSGMRNRPSDRYATRFHS
jgi:hypothetical protein